MTKIFELSPDLDQIALDAVKEANLNEFNERSEKWNTNRHKYIIDVNKQLPERQHALRIRNSENKYISIATLGNFSLIIGKAKARKSFFVQSLVAAATSGKEILNSINGVLPADKKQVLYFDTEQDESDCMNGLRRINKLPEGNGNLVFFGLRELTPKERLEAIEIELLNNHKMTGLVIIDGVKDLVTSINDEEQATAIASKLLKWTEDYEIHIINVLHQNKSDQNARGHIGTELVNKAETVLEVSKSEGNNEISVVTPIQTRQIEPPVIAFEINDQGLPICVEDFEIKTETNKNRFDITDLGAAKTKILLLEVFSAKEVFSYSELALQIKICFKNQFNKSIGTNRAKELISYCKNNDWLIQEQPKAPYKLNIEDVPLDEVPF
jgi:hypothetical protein